MTITNPKRKERVEEFLDKDHGEVMDKYYELMDERDLDAETVQELLILIQKDPDFYDPYLAISEYLHKQGKYKESRKLAKEAYERAVKRIADYKGNYPKRIEWGWLGNRHIIRALGNWARVLWQEDKGNEALDIFRRLLRANPNDNTGCRFDILAIRMNLKSSFLEERFSSGKGEGFLEAAKVDSWFDKNNKKFPEEFESWFKTLEENEIVDDESSEEWEYFDDCPICQDMKKAEEEGRTLSIQELRESFKKAKKSKKKHIN